MRAANHAGRLRVAARILGRLLLFIAVFRWSAHAGAHRLVVHRALFLEPAPNGRLEIMAMLRIPGLRPDLISAYDRDRNGELDDQEREGLKALLVERALDGVALQAGTSTLSLGRTQIKLAIGPGLAGIRLALQGEIRIGPGRTQLKLLTRGSSDTLGVVILAGSRAVENSSRGQPQSGRLQTTLAGTDRLSFTLSAE